MDKVHRRKPSERKLITLNKCFQPVASQKKVRSELSSFLGTIARGYVPLNYVNWAQVPETEKDAYWGFVLDKYIIPQEGRDWVMRTICDLWRLHKSRTKARYYLSKDNDEDRIANKPDKIPLEEFKALLVYWADEHTQKISASPTEISAGQQQKSVFIVIATEICFFSYSNRKLVKDNNEVDSTDLKEKEKKLVAAKNSTNRRNIIDTHTAGTTSFAQISHEMKLKNPKQVSPRKSRLFIETRKRDPKKKYKTDTEAIKTKIEDIEKIITSNGESDTTDQLFCEAETSHGPTWLVGRHVKPSKKKEKNIIVYEDNFVQQLRLEIKEELAAEMEEKLNKKVQENLRMVLKKLGEANPSFNLEVEELYTSNSSDGENGTPVTEVTPIEGTKAMTTPRLLKIF
ncbi:hypothetical protein OROMI_004728 [Orobanche minor]